MVGVDFQSVHVTGVRLREVSQTTAEAEVEYSIPNGEAGNDNWVSYEYINKDWKVAGTCAVPIGSSETSFSTGST